MELTKGPGIEHPLMYLPHKPVQNVARGQSVYDGSRPSDQLYAVITGRVRITMAEPGGAAIARIVTADGLFGESCLIGARPGNEHAVAVENATLMAWTSTEIEQLVQQHPRLGIALSQYLVSVCLELQNRIEDVAVHKIPERVMLAFIRLANELGTPLPDGSIRMPSLTHQAIAEYIGTSREIVTFHMNRLRRQGMLKYNRKYIDVAHSLIQEELRRHGVTLARQARAV